MLLSFLYHRIGDIKYSNTYEMLVEHLSHVRRYPIVVPGESLSLKKLQVCLTFDDAYHDFYHYLFPLIKKWKIKVVLAVPVGFIQEKTDLPSHLRLKVSYKEATNQEVVESKVPYCTWEELKEMADTGLVHIASHGHYHQNLLDEGVDLEKEIILSKEILERKLQVPVETFVYPLGKFNQEVHEIVKSYYTYAMRIGSSINLGWQNSSGLIYRAPSDDLKSIDAPLKLRKWPSYLFSYIANTLRQR